ncbi:pentapeptide repeat-containing protein [Sphingobacterium paramultivorum]|uniref:pentapeptide repeat-containing protein n=1 Tax=Sphingobacterium paramultivorum TaxID=2886510 RepID=UPI00192D6C2F|nr:pentapeptide repeat-containing protein [Sphingobacterium paramultivorum]WSO16440.1 pentapeptide repeat-containing protein [Sphingobacterium paramultivorum]
MADVKFTASDLRKTIFEYCEFNGVSFKSCDMRGINFDGQVFVDVKFDNADLANSSFSGVILRNVSFRPTFALTNKYYKSIKTIDFDGASMDKLTYAALKGWAYRLRILFSYKQHCTYRRHGSAGMNHCLSIIAIPMKSIISGG